MFFLEVVFSIVINLYKNANIVKLYFNKKKTLCSTLKRENRIVRFDFSNIEFIKWISLLR